MLLAQAQHNPTTTCLLAPVLASVPHHGRLSLSGPVGFGTELSLGLSGLILVQERRPMPLVKEATGHSLATAQRTGCPSFA